MASRGARQATSLYRQGRAVASADFDQNFQPINADYPSAAGSTYTVREGDTLYTIDRAVWGDSAMWYPLPGLTYAFNDSTPSAARFVLLIGGTPLVCQLADAGLKLGGTDALTRGDGQLSTAGGPEEFEADERLA